MTELTTTAQKLHSVDTTPVAAEGEPRAVFDRAGLLSRVDGDRETLQLLTDLFRADVGKQLSDLAAALQSQDVSTVKRLAHSLKGASANLGGVSASKVAKELELQARDGQLSQSPRTLAQLQSFVEELLGQLDTLLKEI